MMPMLSMPASIKVIRLATKNVHHPKCVHSKSGMKVVYRLTKRVVCLHKSQYSSSADSNGLRFEAHGRWYQA